MTRNGQHRGVMKSVASLGQRTHRRSHSQLIEFPLTQAVPRPQTSRPPRPATIDIACIAPDDQAHTVVAQIYGYKVHRRITPGSDPTAVWESMCSLVETHSLGLAG